MRARARRRIGHASCRSCEADRRAAAAGRRSRVAPEALVRIGHPLSRWGDNAAALARSSARSTRRRTARFGIWRSSPPAARWKRWVARRKRSRSTSRRSTRGPGAESADRRAGGLQFVRDDRERRRSRCSAQCSTILVRAADPGRLTGYGSFVHWPRAARGAARGAAAMTPRGRPPADRLAAVAAGRRSAGVFRARPNWSPSACRSSAATRRSPISPPRLRALRQRRRRRRSKP